MSAGAVPSFEDLNMALGTFADKSSASVTLNFLQDAKVLHLCPPYSYFLTTFPFI